MYDCCPPRPPAIKAWVPLLRLAPSTCVSSIRLGFLRPHLSFQTRIPDLASSLRLNSWLCMSLLRLETLNTASLPPTEFPGSASPIRSCSLESTAHLVVQGCSLPHQNGISRFLPTKLRSSWTLPTPLRLGSSYTFRLSSQILHPSSHWAHRFHSSSQTGLVGLQLTSQTRMPKLCIYLLS